MPQKLNSAVCPGLQLSKFPYIDIKIPFLCVLSMWISPLLRPPRWMYCTVSSWIASKRIGEINAQKFYYLCRILASGSLHLDSEKRSPVTCVACKAANNLVRLDLARSQIWMQTDGSLDPQHYFLERCGVIRQQEEGRGSCAPFFIMQTQFLCPRTLPFPRHLASWCPFCLIAHGYFSICYSRALLSPTVLLPPTKAGIYAYVGLLFIASINLVSLGHSLLIFP